MAERRDARPTEGNCRCCVHPDHPCASPITAEDLLCDQCRAAGGGCAVIAVNGEWLGCHTGKADDFHWTVVTPFGTIVDGMRILP